MAHEQESNLAAQPEQDESILVFRVIGVPHEQAIVVRKHGRGFLEPDPMTSLIGRVLLWVPLKNQVVHTLILHYNVMAISLPHRARSGFQPLGRDSSCLSRAVQSLEKA